MKIRLLILTLLLTTHLVGCKKDIDHPVPNVKVEISLLITDDLELQKLEAVGNYAVINGGVNGIILYRPGINESLVAYDRQCPYKIEDNCAVDPSPGTAECPCCGSLFELFYGGVMEGPSKHGLKPYRVQYDYPFIWITNYKD